MASSLLDELPCLLDEADELMARLGFYMKLVAVETPKSRSSATTGTRTATLNANTTDEAQDDASRAWSPAAIRAAMAASDMDALFKFFAKQFLHSQPFPLEKMVAQLPHTQNARACLQFVAKKVFHLMKRVHHWQRAAWGLVTQFFAESSYLAFEKHRVLTRLLLNTVVKYVKVHLLWTSWRAKIPSLFAVHTFFSHSAAAATGASLVPLPSTTASPPLPGIHPMYSPLEHADHHLREYVLCFGSNPLAKIQQDFQQHPDAGEIARNLTALTVSCFESFLGCHDLEQLRNQTAFDVETFFQGDYAALGVYEDLLYSREQAEWVLCVALCLPQQLRAAPRNQGSRGVHLWDFVRVIAQDQLMMVVFRDTVVNIHSLLYQQIALTAVSGAGASSSSALVGLSSSPPSSSLGQPSLKKMVSALSKHALRSCADHHSQRRQFAAWLLTSSIRLLTQNAALVAPLFPMLLGALATARDEIEWVFCHEDHCASSHLLLPTHVKTKHLQRVHNLFTGNAQACGELLALVHKLRGLVHQNLSFVERYYEEFLANGDADAIAYAIHELLTPLQRDGDASSSRFDSRVQEILRGFAAKDRYRSEDSSEILAASWRREWRQLSVVLLTSTPELPCSFLRLMERACTHSKYVASSRDVLEKHAQCSKWWWFAGVFEKMFQQLLVAGSSRSSSGSEAVAMVEIVRATISGIYEMDEIVEDAEAQEEFDSMTELYERMGDAVGVQLGLAIDKTVSREAALQCSAHQRSDAPRDQGVVSSKKSEKPRQEARLTSSSSSGKTSESRLATSISGRMSNREKPRKPTMYEARDSCSSGSVASLVRAEEALSSLVGAIHTQMANAAPQTSYLGGLVERHVRFCFVRFLRGLVVFTESSSSTSGISNTPRPGAAASASTASSTICGLRCSLHDAYAEFQCYLNCVQRLFRNAPFVDLTRVVLDTLASECRVQSCESKDSVAATHSLRATISSSALLLAAQKWTLIERFQWFYSSMLAHKCAPVASTAPMIASRPRHSFVLSTLEQSRQSQPDMDPTQFATLDALRCLHRIIGSKGIKGLGASIMGLACDQVTTLRRTLEQDQIALIRFGKSIDEPYNELLMAVKQMTRLEDFVTQTIQIGLTLFFASLLQQLEPSFSIQNDLQWQRTLTIESATADGDAGGSAAQRTWNLLPIAFAASFHSSLWKRTKYVGSLDATDTNAHMSCVAVLHLLHLAQASGLAASRSTTPTPTKLPDADHIPLDSSVSQQQTRELLRRVVRLSSQVVLGLRSVSKDLPSPAMLAALRMFAEMASASPATQKHGGGLETGIFDECLPEIVLQTASIG